MKHLRTWTGDASPAARVFACTVPFIFLHKNYQPHLAAGQVDAYLSDFAILAAVLAGLASGLADGFAPLRSARWVWWSGGAFLVFILLSLSWARHGDPSYAIGSHLVSALKFCEYACLAPAAALALRNQRDRRIVYWAFALWGAVLTAIGVLQFFGAIGQLRGHHPFDREPSYLGEHDFAAFSGAGLSIALAALLLVMRRRLAVVGGIAGGIGVALAAALDAIGGMWVTVIALIAIAHRRVRVTSRRAVSVLVVAALVTGASFALRGHTFVAFIRFLGIRPSSSSTSGSVQSWGQRVLLGYIGVEIWLHHPVAGVGWQESMLPHSFDPVLPAARKHFAKKQPPIAFPSPQHEWGVQNGVLQTLADLGIIGLALLVAIACAVVRVVARILPRAPPMLLFETLATLGWLVFGTAVFVGTGLLAGAPVDAQIWLAVGLIVGLNHSLTTDS